jgi:hypothetical protein
MPTASKKQSTPIPRHLRQFTMVGDDAIEVLVSKIPGNASRERQRERLQAALKRAMEQYRDAGERERKAFFHGMLTGYAVALKLW